MIIFPEGELIEGGGLAFRGDGKLYVATRRGDIWLVENPLAKLILEGRFGPKDVVPVDVMKGEFEFGRVVH